MQNIEELKENYRHFSDARLRSIAKEAFTFSPEIQQILRDEIEKRCINDIEIEYETTSEYVEQYSPILEDGTVLLEYATIPQRVISRIIDSCIPFMPWLFWGDNTLSEIVMLISFLVNYLVLEFVYGKTVGKFITKTKVLKIDGEDVDFGNILARFFCRFIPFNNISIIFDKNRSWHDKFSDTYVAQEQTNSLAEEPEIE